MFFVLKYDWALFAIAKSLAKDRVRVPRAWSGPQKRHAHGISFMLRQKTKKNKFSCQHIYEKPHDALRSSWEKSTKKGFEVNAFNQTSLKLITFNIFQSIGISLNSNSINITRKRVNINIIQRCSKSEALGGIYIQAFKSRIKLAKSGFPRWPPGLK